MLANALMVDRHDSGRLRVGRGTVDAVGPWGPRVVKPKVIGHTRAQISLIRPVRKGPGPSWARVRQPSDLTNSHRVTTRSTGPGARARVERARAGLARIYPPASECVRQRRRPV